ncbi:MAG: peptide chain release factor N(5)-glutamine methyltransferase [Holosporaceae bacterium]|nr:peptide chain release factor N(5)-glutamine methyltransferase [Holosporaceae bacterium]
MRFVRAIIAEYGRNGESMRNLHRILAKVKGVAYEQIVFGSADIFLTDEEEAVFRGILDRLEKNEPLSKILNCRCFWNHEFFVNSHVLDPRQETELIVEMVLERFDRKSSINFLDLGTGSGCLLLSLLTEYVHSHGLGIDVSSRAIEVAKYNKNRLQIPSANFMTTDWKDFETKEKFDVIISNPPYIKTDHIALLDECVKNYDPLLALDGGMSGLDSYHFISARVNKWMRPGGLIFLEIGYNQTEEVSRILLDNNLIILEIRKDLNGIARVILVSVSYPIPLLNI